MLSQSPGAGKRVARGAQVTIFASTGAITVPDVVGQARKTAVNALKKARLHRGRHGADHRGPGKGGPGDLRVPAGRLPRAAGRHRDDLGGRGRRPDHDHAGRMRVAVLGGGISSEHEVSLRSAASVAAGLREAGHETVEVTIEPRRPLDARRGSRSSSRRARGCSAATSSSRCCTARRRGRQRPGAAGGARRPLRRLGRRGLGDLHGQARLQGPAGAPRDPPGRLLPGRGGGLAGDRRRLRAAGLGEACAARLERRDLARRRARRSSTGPSRQARRHDPRVIVEAPAPGKEVECSLLGNEDPVASPPGRDRHQGSDWYDYEAKYAEGGMELRRARAGSPTAPGSASASSRGSVFTLCGCSGLARCDFFVDGDGGARQRAQHDPRLHRDERLRQALRGRRDRLSRSSATGWSSWRSSATRASARVRVLEPTCRAERRRSPSGSAPGRPRPAGAW